MATEFKLDFSKISCKNTQSAIKTLLKYINTETSTIEVVSELDVSPLFCGLEEYLSVCDLEDLSKNPLKLQTEVDTITNYFDIDGKCCEDFPILKGTDFCDLVVVGIN